MLSCRQVPLQRIPVARSTRIIQGTYKERMEQTWSIQLTPHREHKDHTRSPWSAWSRHGEYKEHTTNKEHKERRTGSTRNIQGAHGAHGADMENIRSILLTRNTRNAARSIHKDGVRRGFETNADCYSMTRGNLEIKNLGPGGEGWGPAFPFVSLYGAPVMKFLQDTRLHSTAPYPFITCTVYIDSVQTSFRVYLSYVRSSSRDPCYRARRGGVGDDGGIQPEHRGERKDALDTAVA